MPRPRICKACKKEGFVVKMVPMGKLGNMKCPDCGIIFKKDSGK